MSNLAGMVRRGWWWAAVALLLSGGGCARSQDAPRTAGEASDAPLEYPYSIVTTTGMIGDIVRQVAGEHATVVNLIGEGVDPHLYSVSSDDVELLAAADVIFYNGLLLEGKMVDTLIQMAQRMPVVAVTERVKSDELLSKDDDPNHADPHVWMDVSKWSRAVGVVAEALQEFDPAHAEDYAANAARYQRTLKDLDAYVTSRIRTVPQAQRVLITAHDAFNYFGAAYDIEVLGIQGISTESEAGLDDINRLVDLIVSRNVSAVFVETTVEDKNVRSLVEGAAARGHTVRIGGELFSDAMGAPGTYRGTYVGMLDHNATTIARALGGAAPAGGMNARLQEPDAP